ncbi:single-stranded TG1-3 DNA-binding protein-like [Hibiscus syriacus]|uniref:single-stranded TG1-3 DNA-binding protein-like n=1 Tax=Hibiscus syriacus TaxID=106335 RepID=UPI0019248B73|nr:single-stranded TG1-3 DNA-binding protein-like [Hibiscus syriacus]
MRGSKVISLFVQNIPIRYYLKGLIQVFGRHGEVVDSYIARRMDRIGKRFGFIRFANKEDADRTRERLVGFSLNGFQLAVKEAKPRERHLQWRKKNFEYPQHIDQKGNQKDNQTTKDRAEVSEGTRSSTQSRTGTGLHSVESEVKRGSLLFWVLLRRKRWRS